MRQKPFAVRLVLAGILGLFGCCVVPLVCEALGDTELEAPAYCLKEAADKMCKGPECKRSVKEACYHGDCSETGECVCHGCWSGPSCNQPGNLHVPAFAQALYEEYISPDQPSEYPFLHVRATDADADACGASAAECPCAEVVHSLVDAGAEGPRGANYSPFTIHAGQGAISLVAGAQLVPGSKHSMKVYAENPSGGVGVGVVSVVIYVSDAAPADGDQAVKLRKLQAVEVTELGPNNTLDISFQPTDDSLYVGTLGLGTRVECALTISIPESVQVEDVQVEIFTEDENGTLAIICPPSLTTGEELEITESSPTPVQSYAVAGNPFLTDAAVYTFGNVSNQNTSTAPEASQIVLTFAIVMHEDLQLNADERYWVSAGVDYNGQTRLWVGQIGFLVAQEPQFPLPTNLSLTGPIIFHKGEVDVFNVDLNVYRRVANLTVQATAGSSVQNSLLICELQLCSTGSGFCLNTDLDLATFSVEPTSQNIYDSIFQFGNIVNGGAANSTLDSRISMDIVAFLQDDADIVAESSHDLVASADDGSQQIQDTLTFTAKAARSYITPGRTLELNVTTVDGDDQLVPGEVVKVRVHLIVPPSTLVTNAQLRLQAPSTGGFLICSARVNHVGEDMSCVRQRREAIEATFALSGSQATLTLGGVANTGAESTADGVSNVIGVDFVVKSTATDLGLHNQAHSFTAQLQSRSLSQIFQLTTITDPAVIDYPLAPIDSGVVMANFDLMDPNVLPHLAPGEYILLAVRPVIQPDTMFRYTVSALLNTSDATIVDMRLLWAGEHIACGLLDEPVATYFDAPDGNTRNMAELPLGLLYNFARPGTPVTKEDTVEIMLAVKAMEYAPEGDIALAASLLVGATRLWVAEGNITVEAAISQSPELPTNNTLELKPEYNREMIPGTEVVALHTLIIPANTSYKFVVNYTTTAYWLKVVKVNVTSVGDKLLCITEQELSPDYGELDNGMYAIIDLGYMCHVPINNNTEAAESTLILEVTLSALNSSDLEVGAMAKLLAAVTVSNILGQEEKDTASLLLSVALPATTFKLCCPESSFYMVPGEVERCNVTLELLDRVLNIRLELQVPFNQTAAMTFLDVALAEVGLNIDMEPLSLQPQSSGNTTQTDRLVVDLGLVRHKASPDVDLSSLNPQDNTIVLYLDIQMADSLRNLNGTENVLQAGVSVSHGIVVWVAYYKLTVLREGLEHPSLNTTFTHNSSLITHSVGDTVWYHLDLNHSSVSRAEVINLKGHIFLPPYIQFQTFAYDLELSPLQPVVTHNADTTGFYFEVPTMFFTDRIAFSIQTTIRTDYRYKMTKDWRGTTPVELVFYMKHYDNVHHMDGAYFSEPMEYVTFDFIVPYPEIPDPEPVEACPSPIAQGIASSAISDCQITASYEPDPAASASHARLNGSSAWKTLARAGSFLYDRWIKVDLGKITTVTGVQTQGGSSATATGDLGQFEVLYSMDNILYKAATPADNKIFDHQKDSPTTNDVVVTHNFLAAVTARYVLLNLTSYDYNTAAKWYNALRLEVLGCAVSTSMAPDICPTQSAPSVAQQYKRGFLADVDSNTLFVCDSVTHGQSGLRKEVQDSVYTIQWKPQDMRCFMMSYTDKHWTGLDPRLRNIFGLLSSTKRIYGLMGNSPDSYVASDPPYADWFLTPTADFTDAEADSTFVPAVPVPMDSDTGTGFTYGSPDAYSSSPYAIADWKATLSGIYKGAEKVMDWNECCQPACAASGGPDDCT